MQQKTEEDLVREIADGTANLPNCKWQVMKEGSTGIMKDKVFWFNPKLWPVCMMTA